MHKIIKYDEAQGWVELRDKYDSYETAAATLRYLPKSGQYDIIYVPSKKRRKASVR